jgi:hypothetical protein
LKRSSFRAATFALVTLLASAVNCGRDVTSPLADGDQGVRYARGLSFKAVFPAGYEKLASSAAPLVAFTNVKVTLRHSDGTIALDTLIAFPSDADSIQVSLNVKLLASASASGEQMTLTLDYITSGGTTVFSGGPVAVNALPSVLGQTSTPPVIVPVSYTGPGAGATKVVISPRNLTVNGGGAFTFTAQAFDAANNVIPGTPIIFSSSNPTLAALPNSGSGSGTASSGRGTVQITAALLTGGLTDVATLTVQPLPTTIAATSGTGQSGAVGSTLATPIMARVTAADGTGVSGVAVTFAPSSGGSVGTATVLTDINGNAQTTWTLGTTPGAQTVSATAAGLTGTAVFTATATPLPATKLAISQQPVNGLVGTPLTVVVTAQDASGNTATSFTGPVSIAFGANAASATLGGTTTVNAVGGVATFGGLTVSKIGSAFTLVASSGTLASATTSAFDVVAGTASQLTFTTQPGNIVAGANFSPDVSVTVRDAQGNVATGFTGSVTLAFATSPSGAAFIGTPTANAVAGVATFSGLSVNRAGAYQLSATSANLATATSASFNVVAGTAASVNLVSGGNQTAAASAVLPLPIVVAVRDALGNPVSGAAVAFAAASGNGSVAPTTATTDATGQASTTWTVGTTTGSESMTATVTGLPVLSIGATVSGGATQGVVTQLVLTSGSALTVAGTAFTTTYEARDGLGAIVTSFNGNVTLGFGANPASGTLLGTTTVAAVNGVITFSNSIRQASDAYTLVATSGSISSTPWPITVSPTNPSQLVLVSGGGQSGVVSTALPAAVVVKLVDAYGNVIPGSAINYIPGAGSGSAVPATGTTNSLGQVSTMWTLGTTVGTQTLTASSSGVNPLPITATGTAAGAGIASMLVFRSSPAAATAGSPFTVTVEARDANNVLVPTFSANVTLALTANPAGGTLAGTATVAAANGVATFSGLSITKAGTGYELGAASGSLTSSPSPAFGITSSTATALSFTTQPSSTGAGTVIAPSIGVTALDTYGNVATSYTGPVTLAFGANPGGATLAGTTTVNAVAGVAVFNNISVGSQGVGYTLVASRGTVLVSATSAPFNIVSQTLSWTNGSGGNWSLASNWSLGRVPTAGDSVVIGMSGTYTVVLDTTFTGTFITMNGTSGTQTLTLSSRPLTLSGVLTIGAHAAFQHFNGTINGTGSVNNQGSLTLSSVTANVPVSNSGTMVANGGSSVTGAFANLSSGTLQVVGNNGSSTLTIGNSFTNQGIIQLTSMVAGYGAALNLSNGVLTNAPGAQIQSLAGAGGQRTLGAALNNQGTVTITGPLALDKASAQHSNTGTITANADFAINESGASPTFVNGGGMTVSAGHTIVVSNGAFVQLASGGISGTGALTLGSATASFAVAPVVAAFSASSSTVALNSGLSTSAMALAFSNSTITGSGAITNPSGQSITISSSSLTNTIANSGTIVFTGAGSFGGAYTNTAGSLLRVSGTNGSANLSIANGFANDGTIDLTSSIAGYASSLAVLNGTLNNTATGTITASAGAGGSRELDVQLDNHGTITVDAPLTMARGSSQSTNSGQITLNGGDLQVSQSGTSPSFTNTGTITANAGRTLTINGVSGGTFAHQAGATLAGGGAITINNTGAAFNAPFSLSSFAAFGSTITFNTSLSTSGLSMGLTNSVVTGTGTLTNVAFATISATNSSINTPIVNHGTILNTGAGTLGGSITNAVDGTIRVSGSNGSAAITVTTAFVNQGAIELTSAIAGYASSLTVTNGTLINASGATILADVGAGGQRSLYAAVDNQGTVTVNAPFTMQSSGAQANSGAINVAGADFLVSELGGTSSFSNTGTIAVSPGRTLSFQGGTFAHHSSAVLNGGGALSLSSTAVTFDNGFTLAALTANSSVITLNTSIATNGLSVQLTGSTVNGSGVIANVSGQTISLASSTVSTPIGNNGTIVATGFSTISGAFGNPSGGLLRVVGNNGSATLIITNGFTNQGGIELSSAIAGYSSTLNIINGTLLNAPGATFLSDAGAGGGRALNGQFNNQGTMTITGPLTIQQASAQDQNSGTINVSGADLYLSLSGSSPTFVNTGTISVGPGHLLTIVGGTFAQQAGATLNGGGALALSQTSATFNTGFTLGSLSLSSTGLTLNTSVSTTNFTLTSANSTINGPGSLVNGSGKTTTLQSTTLNGPFVNQGTLVFSGFGTFAGAVTNAPGAMLQVAGNNGSADLTITNGFTNNGTVDLTSVGAGYSSSLTVTNGTLLNSSTGTLSSSAGAGGGRTLSAQLDNEGQFTVSGNTLTLSKASAAHVNNGTINLVSADLLVTQSGTSPSFTNSNAIAVPAGRTLSISGGTFVNGGSALIGGAGTLSLSGLTATFNSTPGTAAINTSGTTLNLPNALSTSGIALYLNTTVVNGAGSITNAPGQTLTLSSATINVPLTNQGTIEQNGGSSFSNTFTTAGGSVLRITGNNGSAALTVSNFFTNNGLIDLTSVGAGYSATLGVTSGTFVNGAGGILQSSFGAGGGRQINAVVNNLGTVNVAVDGTGVLSVNGGFSNSGTLNMKIAGATSYDQLAVSGNLSLSGTLNASTVGYTPGSGTSFGILASSGTVTGTFANANLPAGFTNPPTYTANSVTLVHP